MKRSILLASALLLIASQAFGGVGWYDRLRQGANAPGMYWSTLPNDNTWWNDNTLLFWAPLDNTANPLQINVGTGPFTFTRTGSATYISPDNGYLSTAADNVLRIEAKGALIEFERVVSSLRSDDFTTYWTTTGATISADNIIGPDGVSLTADKVLASNITTLIRPPYYAETNRNYNASAFVKKGNSSDVNIGCSAASGISYYSAFAYYNFDTNTISFPYKSGAYGKVNLSNGWVRIWVSLSIPVDSAYAYCFLRPSPYVDNQYTYVAGFNVNDLPGGPVSYVPTVASPVTKYADFLSFPTSGNISVTAGTIAFEFTPQFSNLDLEGGTSYLLFATNLLMRYTSSDQKQRLFGNVNNIQTGQLIFNSEDTHKIAISWGANGLSIYRNGGMQATGASYTAPANFGTTIRIGGSNVSTEQASGHYRNFRIWNRQFTDEEMKRITR